MAVKFKRLLFNKKLIIFFLFQTGLFGALFAQDNWTVYNTENSIMLDNHINCLKLDGSKLWIGTGWGLYSLENNIWVNHTINLPHPSVKCISINENGTVYVGTINGMAIYDSGYWLSYTNTNSVLSSQVNDVVFHKQETYIATIDGLFKMINEEISLVLNSASLKSNFINIRTMESVGDSLALGSVNDGIGYLHNDTVIWRTTSNSGINDNTCLDIAMDSSKNLWIGAPYGGLTSHLNNNVWINYNTMSSESWPSNSLNTILIDEEYFMFVGSNGAGFFRFYYEGSVPTTTIYNTTNSGIPSNNVLSLAKGDGGAYWIGTESGLVKWETSVGTSSLAKNNNTFNYYIVNELRLSKKSNLELYDLTGKVVFSENNRQNIDLSHLVSGIYLLVLNGKAYKIIKE